MAQKTLRSSGGDSSNESPSVDHHQASPNISKPQNLEGGSWAPKNQLAVGAGKGYLEAQVSDMIIGMSKMIECSKSLEKSFGMNWAECHHFQPSKNWPCGPGQFQLTVFPSHLTFFLEFRK